MKEISFKNLVHTFSLDLREIPEGFRVDLIKKNDSYEVWLYNINCILSDEDYKRRMLITKIPETENGCIISLEEVALRAEKRLINNRYHYDDIEEYVDVFMNEETYNKYFGIKKSA